MDLAREVWACSLALISPRASARRTGWRPSFAVTKSEWTVTRCSTTGGALQVTSFDLAIDGALLTSFAVFSAPRYCDSTENRGAYINIGPDYKLKYEQFDAVPHPDIKPMVRLPQFLNLELNSC